MRACNPHVRSLLGPGMTWPPSKSDISPFLRQDFSRVSVQTSHAQSARVFVLQLRPLHKHLVCDPIQYLP